MSVLSSFSEEVRIASPLLSSVTPLPLSEKRSGTKLVKYLAKYQRFSIGSLRKTADWLYYFVEYFRYVVILLYIYGSMFVFILAVFIDY